jgi:excinuclease ABC subunit C
MVSFRNGIPDKSGYRRFLIKSIKGIDDFAGIEEVVFRRYKRVKDEHRSFPDLLVIDGGAGQLSAAIKSLEKLDVKIPVISLAKKDEEIYIPGRFSPMKLNRKNIGLQLLMKIRDEAHRFAINYNRLLRRKDLSKG